MTTRTLAAAALLCAASAALAAEAAPQIYEVRHFAGTVGRTKAFASLRFGDGEVKGEYAYASIPYGSSGWLSMAGTLAPDGAVEIDESTVAEVGSSGVPMESGHFSGRVDGARSRLTGTWSAPEGSKGAGKPLPFDFSAFARTVAWGDAPDRRILLLEFLDLKPDIARLANDEVRAHAERLLAGSQVQPAKPCCGYVPTFWSDRLVSVVFEGARDGQTVHEGLLFGYKGGKLARLAVEDVLRIDASWPKRLDALVKALHYDALDCPTQLNGIAITGRGALRLFVGCKPGTGKFPEQALLVPAKDVGALLVPGGPAASVIGKKK
ncbi:MAG TPA: hypothetical protein VFL83_23025 [Anaeromyxobacter sp.]|nr:hypothetical protein [Anaeromyxobacter sp.]